MQASRLFLIGMIGASRAIQLEGGQTGAPGSGWAFAIFQIAVAEQVANTNGCRE